MREKEGEQGRIDLASKTFNFFKENMDIKSYNKQKTKLKILKSNVRKNIWQKYNSFWFY